MEKYSAILKNTLHYILKYNFLIVKYAILHVTYLQNTVQSVINKLSEDITH